MATSILQTIPSDISFRDMYNEKAIFAIQTVDVRNDSPEAPTLDFGQSSNMETETFPALENTAPKRSLLLDLPLEIRLQIYSHLLPIHPAKHAHLSPSAAYPPATSSAYFLRALSTTLALSFPNFEPAGKSEPTVIPTAVPRGCGFIPSALLSTCRQVYEEARGLPWQQNEFVFINWFCSGVYAARAFLRALKPWQRTSMRWARVEVLGRDLKDSWVATMVGGRAGGGEWKDLCGLWSGEDGIGGLHGLRLGVKGRIGTGSKGVLADGSGVVCDPATAVDRGVLDIDAEWITSGLSQIKSLKRIELDIEDEEVSRDVKVQFCIALGNKLSLPGKRVHVLYVEKVAQEKKVLSQEELAWGGPEDDYIWGLDS